MSIKAEQAQFEFGFACDVGRMRKGKPNQDAVAVVLPNSNEPWHPPLLLVADGLGRYSGGELASQTVVNTFTREFKRSQHPTEYAILLERCVQAAHKQVRTLGMKDENLSLMGSTIAAVVLEADRLFALNIGDSRVYLFDHEKIHQVSRDHSWTAAQVQAGVLTKEEARVHPDRNRLIMSITAKRTEINFHLAEEKIDARTIVLLCSDGLWGVLPETLLRAAAVELSPQAAANKLVKMTNASKGPDNISVIIARRTGFDGKNRDVNLEDTEP